MIGSIASNLGNIAVSGTMAFCGSLCIPLPGSQLFVLQERVDLSHDEEHINQDYKVCKLYGAAERSEDNTRYLKKKGLPHFQKF
jgi:hypothetical protein